MEDKDYYAMTEDQRSFYRRHNVGMVYQQSLWIKSLKVGENVGFPLNLLDWDAGKIWAKVSEVLEIVGMTKWHDYHPSDLSSGQQQKISLARALVIDPPLLVADEPTGNLDTVSGRELLETFRKLIDRGKTVIMVTHELEYLKYATKIYHIVDGEIVSFMAPKRIDTKDIKISNFKKELGGDAAESSNVRDKDFLNKINL